MSLSNVFNQSDRRLHPSGRALRLLLSLVLMFGPPPLYAQEAPPGAANFAGIALAPNDLAAFRLGGAAAQSGRLEVVAVDGQRFRQALRVTGTTQSLHVYDLQLVTPIIAAVEKGDVMLASFWVRGESGTGEAQAQFVFEQSGEPYTKSAQFPVSAGANWRQIQLPFSAAASYAPGRAKLQFNLGYGPQSIEIGGLTVANLGDAVKIKDLPFTGFTYQGREANAPWRAAAETRIEQIRKGDLRVIVKDGAGKVVPTAKVRVKMRRHAFGFGSAVAGDLLLDQTPTGQKYREMVARLFNKAVTENDLKWPQWETNPQRAAQSVQWLREHNIEVRGHNLIWPSWTHLPKDLRGLKDDPAALRERIARHIRDACGAFKGQLVEWDVVNEAFANHDVMDVLGADVMAEWFRLAREADPEPRLFINDYSILSNGGNDVVHQAAYEKTIRDLIAAGAPLDGIGMQSHFGWSLTSPDKLMQILDRYAATGKTIQSTEFDINVTDEALQADYLRDFMTTLFSHPAVNGIVMWGFWEGRHWKPDAALWRKDWSIKPAGKAWENLVFKKWWTDVQGQTDAQGLYQTRGFLGDYEVEVSSAGKTKTMPATLSHEGQTLNVVLD